MKHGVVWAKLIVDLEDHVKAIKCYDQAIEIDS